MTRTKCEITTGRNATIVRRKTRFPKWAEGRGEFDLDHLAKLRLVRPKPPRPRVFISHRRADVNLAKRIAYEACKKGFEYWLDVFDPNLTAAGALSQPAQARAVAVIIEMAILNCTHVVAVMTKHTNGSQWVPYEYGRIKEPALFAVKVAAWIDPKKPPASTPEYLLLGERLFQQSDLLHWLKRERKGYAKVPCSWGAPIPPPL